MNRLTKRDAAGQATRVSHFVPDAAARERLCQYEETGLEPGEGASLLAEIARLQTEVASLREWQREAREAMQSVAEYLDDYESNPPHFGLNEPADRLRNMVGLASDKGDF